MRLCQFEIKNTRKFLLPPHLLPRTTVRWHCHLVCTWASIPAEAMMHFPPISDFPLFLVIDYKFRIFPYFPCFSTFPPLFRENYYFLPTLRNFHPVFKKFTGSLHTLCVFRFPPTLTMMHL